MPVDAIEDRGAQRRTVCELDPAPIPTSWILEGAPEARGRILCCSSDDMALTVMWDCTAGRFNWFYDIDETVYVMDGRVVVCDAAGNTYTLVSGDVFFFPAGSRFQWTVSHYVRKVAFIHVPLSPKLRLARRAYKALKGIFRPRAGAAAGTAGLLQGR
jgi:uncharacterized protein